VRDPACRNCEHVTRVGQKKEFPTLVECPECGRKIRYVIIGPCRRAQGRWRCPECGNEIGGVVEPQSDWERVEYPPMLRGHVARNVVVYLARGCR